MMGICPYECNNKTEYGYCRTTGCINPQYAQIIFWSHNTNTFPSPCANCKNNPVNGGSGICHCILGGAENAIHELENLPPVQPKRGRWIKDGDVHYCSECGVGLIEFGQGGEPIYFVEGYNRSNHERRITTPGWCSYYMQFCPNCGADMRGGDNGKT